MKLSKDKAYAVLTGDLVRSSALEPKVRQKAFAAVESESRKLMKLFPRSVPFPAEGFRGDGWQLLVTEPAEAFRIGLLFRASLRSLFEEAEVLTRVAIGIGPIDFLPGGRPSGGDGAAFRLSGRGLESLPKSRQLLLSTGDAERDARIDPLVGLIDFISARWTPRQCRAMGGRLLGKSQEEIARLWRPAVTQSAVAQALSSAGAEPVMVALDQVEWLISGGGHKLKSL